MDLKTRSKTQLLTQLFALLSRNYFAMIVVIGSCLIRAEEILREQTPSKVHQQFEIIPGNTVVSRHYTTKTRKNITTL